MKAHRLTPWQIATVLVVANICDWLYELNSRFRTIKTTVGYTRAWMDPFADSHKHVSSERFITLAVVTVLTLTSTVLMMSCASPEFCWDEGAYGGIRKSTAVPRRPR